MAEASQRDQRIFLGLILHAVIVGCALIYVGVQIRNSAAQRAGIPAPAAGTAGQRAPAAGTHFNAEKFKTSIADDHVYGAASAPVSLVSYMDFECPFCVKFYPAAKQLVDGSGGAVNLVLRSYPLPIHAHAGYLANAAECVGAQQGAAGFWSFVDKMFAPGPAPTEPAERVRIATEALGIDRERLDRCLNGNQFAERLKGFVDEANAIGVTGTPSTVLVNHSSGKTAFVVGVQPAEQLRAKIDSLK